MATYSTVLTNIGRTQIINSQITGTALRWSKMAVGDGNGRSVVPSSETTALVNETYRAAINTLYRDPDDATQIIAELVILPQTGGWTLREVGIFDEDDNLVVYGSLPAVVKPVLDEGSGATLTIRCRALVGSEAQVKLIIDPSIVIATRQYAEQYADTKDKALLDSLHGVTLYSNQKDYVSGDIVVQSGQVYVCIAANGPSSVVADVTDTAYWQRVITTDATHSAAGYMSAADKTNLTALLTNGDYELATIDTSHMTGTVNYKRFGRFLIVSVEGKLNAALARYSNARLAFELPSREGMPGNDFPTGMMFFDSSTYYGAWLSYSIDGTIYINVRDLQVPANLQFYGYIFCPITI